MNRLTRQTCGSLRIVCPTLRTFVDPKLSLWVKHFVGQDFCFSVYVQTFVSLCVVRSLLKYVSILRNSSMPILNFASKEPTVEQNLL